MLATLFLVLGLQAAGEPISLHPDNPHYLLFRGKPTVLISFHRALRGRLERRIRCHSLSRRAARPRP